MLVTQLSVEDLVVRIPDGAKVALPPDYSYCAMAAVRALIRRGAKGLHVVGVPTFGFQGDMLIGAGCVETVETSAVTLSEHGLAPRFTKAIKDASIKMMDATCPAVHAALQASEKGIPFIPLRGLIGSDILANRKDWKVGNNPFAKNDDPIVYLPALKPDVALIHAPVADKFGNVWIGVRRELMLMAHASAETFVTAEKIVDYNLMSDVKTKAGTIPGLYVSAIAEAEQGAWPLGMPDGYGADHAHLATYAQDARTDEGFQNYLDQHVYQTTAQAAE
ncbi:MAG: CoA synthetase [Alphaproteobacteria bacterium]|nr:CoA synthetase [Alphaproteobacteria bacterium]